MNQGRLIRLLVAPGLTPGGFYFRFAAVKFCSAVGDAPQRFRINPVLGLQNARGECLLAVAFQHRNRLLADDRPRIGLLDDEMNRRAVTFHARLQRPAMRMQPFEVRQQGRVNIENTAAPACDEPGRQKPHEAGQTDDFDPMSAEFIVKRALESLAIFPERPMIDHCSGDCIFAGAR